jgi:hypothetical protein
MKRCGRLWQGVSAASLGVALVTGGGCTSYTGVRVLAPAYGDVVADLQPTLEWEAGEAQDATYDLVIQPPRAPGSPRASEQVKPFYFREGLTTNRHRVETALEPGSEYDWSVRTRAGGKVSAWTQRKVVIEAIVIRRSRTESPMFQTPAK